MSNYLIDTSIWVTFFTGSQTHIRDFITAKIDEDRIYYNDIILGELLIGALSDQEFSFIRQNFEGFHYLELDKAIFQRTFELGYQLMRKGTRIPLTDLILAAQCLEHGLQIVTLDKHFQTIRHFCDLEMYQIQ